MTESERPTDTASVPEPAAATVEVPDPVGEVRPAPSVTGRTVGILVALWITVAIACLGLVLYGLEPLFQQRTQQQLLAVERADIDRAVNETQGLPGISTPTKAPEPGSGVGVLEFPRLNLQQVVVEGVTSGDTQAGPGHAPGTAGLGQPGNAVVVGRRTAFGGPFNGLRSAQPGDRILVTTTQGQSVYKVDAVRTQTISTDPVVPTLDVPSSTGEPAVAEDPTATDGVSVDLLYGPTKDDRLTLVTSATAVPWNSSNALVVVAKLEGKPFTPTPQGGRTDNQTGLSGDPSAWAGVILAALAFAAAAAAAVLLYRRSSSRVAYLLTAAPLLVFMILVAENGARLFPAWM